MFIFLALVVLFYLVICMPLLGANDPGNKDEEI